MIADFITMFISWCGDCVSFLSSWNVVSGVSMLDLLMVAAVVNIVVAVLIAKSTG